MNTVWKCVISGLFLTLFINQIGLASDLGEGAGGVEADHQELTKADELFGKGTYQTALEAYESIFKQATDPDIRWKAFFRMCESLTRLYRVGEAADKVISTPVPRQMPHQVHFLILKTEMLRKFLSRYSSIQRRDVIDERGKYIFRLTPDEIESEIREAYRQLWELRNELTGMDLKKEGYFFTNTNVDFGMYPSLFDYLILRWTDFLLKEASDVNVGELKPNENLLLVEDFNRPLSFNDPPVLLAAVLMETASRFHQEGRLEAAERWKIKRLLLPEEHPNRFDMVFGRVAYEEKDLLEYEEQAKEILLDWMEEFSTDEAKAEAGLKVAVILRDTDRLVEAVELCEKIEKSYPDTYAKQHARSLRSKIQMPDLILSARAVMPPAKEALTIHARNLKEIHFRVYRVNPQTLKDEYIRYCAENQGDSSDCFEGWSALFGSGWHDRDWRRQWLASYLVGKQPHKAWRITTGDKDDFSFISQIINPPELNAGIYLTVACGDESFNIGSSLVSVCFLNVSDLVLLGSAGFTTSAEEAYYDSMESDGTFKADYEGFHFYTLDAKTGKPVDDVELDVYTKFARRQQGPKKTTTHLRTDREGVAELFLPINTSPRNRIYYSVDALARSKNALSYCNAYLFPSPFITPILNGDAVNS